MNVPVGCDVVGIRLEGGVIFKMQEYGTLRMGQPRKRNGRENKASSSNREEFMKRVMIGCMLLTDIGNYIILQP